MSDKIWTKIRHFIFFNIIKNGNNEIFCIALIVFYFLDCLSLPWTQPSIWYIILSAASLYSNSSPIIFPWISSIFFTLFFDPIRLVISLNSSPWIEGIPSENSLWIWWLGPCVVIVGIWWHWYVFGRGGVLNAAL